jgi:hypothetical protein
VEDNPTFGDLDRLRSARRDEAGRDAYRRRQRERWDANQPLLPPYDEMTDEQRAQAGLYDTYDPRACPDGIAPATWAAYLRVSDAMAAHVPGPAERARGYDNYGRPC